MPSQVQPPQHLLHDRRRSMRSVTPRWQRLVSGIGVLALLLTSLPALLPGFAPEARAEYATGGDGTYRSAIDWFTWGDASNEVITAASVNANPLTYTNTRVVGTSQLVTTCTISDMTVTNTKNPANQQIQTYIPGRYKGDMLDRLYNIGGIRSANTLVNGLASYEPGTAAFNISCSAELDGVKVPVEGLVIADAESTSDIESIGINMPNVMSRRVIEAAKSPGCAADSKVSWDGVTGEVRISSTTSECSALQTDGWGPGSIVFMESADGTTVQSARISLSSTGGKSALALGMMLQTDFGDAPATYGEAGALFQSSWTGGDLLKSNHVYPTASGFTMASASASLRTQLGEHRDAELEQLFSADALGDDLSSNDGSGIDDEDAIEPPGTVSASRGGTYTLPGVRCYGPGYVSGWIDWNGNGVFDSGEISDTPSCGTDASAGQVDLTWNVPADAKEQLGGATSYLRLRIAEDKSHAQQPTGLMPTGEVEDYAVKIELPHLEVTKTSSPTGPVQVGDTVTYTVTATNTGATDFPASNPAILADDLTDVLDDATYQNDAAVTVDGTPTGTVSRTGNQLTWRGPLAAGQTATMTYSVITKAGGDRTLRNVAWDGEIEKPSCEETAQLSGAACLQNLLPGLTVTKSSPSNPDTSIAPAISDIVEYAVTVTNPGPGDYTAQNPASVTDSLADVLDDVAGATLHSGPSASSGPAPTFDAAAKTLTWSGPLAANQSVTITYAVEYTGGGSNQLVNRACVPSSQVAAGQDPCQTVTIPGAKSGALHLVKSGAVVGGVEGQVAQLGDRVQYTFTAENRGNVTLNNLQVTDDKVGAVQCAPTTLEPGQTAQCSAVNTYLITEADVLAENVHNVGTATADVPAGSTPIGEVTAEHDQPVEAPAPALSLTKTGTLANDLNRNGQADLGDGLGYTFLVTNTGNVTITDLVVTDPKLAGLTITCPAVGQGLAPGASVTCTANGTYTVTEADVLNERVDNTATVTGTSPDGQKPKATDDETVDTVAPAASMTLTKHSRLVRDAGTVGVADQGDTIHYWFTVTNTGNVSLSSLTVADQLLADNGITVQACTPDPLAPGVGGAVTTATCETEGDYTVTEADVIAGVVHNQATVNATSPEGVDDPTPATDTEDVTTVPAEAKLGLTKSATLVTDANGNGRADVGDQIEYGFTVANLGNVPMKNVVIDDPRLVGMDVVCTPTSLAAKGQPGDSATCVVEGLYTVTEADLVEAVGTQHQILNTATATATVPESVDEPQWPSDSARVPVTADTPAITLTKTAEVVDGNGDESTTLTGDTIRYTFTVKNVGPLTIKDLQVTDEERLPGVVIECDATELAPDEEVSCWAQGDARYTITEGDVLNGRVDNTATATGVATDGSDVSATGDATVPTDPARAQLVLTKEAVLGAEVADDQVAQVGETVTYGFTVLNAGTVTVRDLTITDAMLTAAGIGIDRCEVEGAVVTSLAPRQQATCFTTQALPVTQAHIDAGVDIHNEATASGVDPQDKPVTSNKATKDVPVATADTSLLLEKLVTHGNEVADDQIAQAGETLTYGFRVTNASNVSVTGLRIDDPKLTQWGISLGQCVLEGTDTVVDSTTVLAPGAVVTCVTSGPRTISQADVDAQAAIVNTAQAFVKDPGGQQVDSNKPTVEVPVAPAAPVLSLEKLKSLEDGVRAEVGTPITYSFRVTNQGNVTLNGLTIDDPKLVEWGLQVGACRLENGAATTSLVPGQSATCQATTPRVVTQADIDAGDPIVNTATATATDPQGEPVPSNESSVTVELVERAPGLALQKDVGTWTDVNGNGIKDAGDSVDWVFRVENTGNVTIHDLQVNDGMLADRGVDISDCDIPTLAVGKSVTCTSGEYTLTEEDIAAGLVHNEATASGVTPDGDPTESDMDDADFLLPNIGYRKDVVSDTTPVQAGSRLTYTVTIQNTGQETGKVYRQDVLDDVLDDATWVQQPSVTSAPAGSTVITSSVVNGRFTISGDLPVGEPVVVTYVLEVKPDAQRTADSSAANFLVDTRNGTPKDECTPDDPECTVTPLPVLSVVKSSDPVSGSAVQPGSVIDYSVVLTNTGSAVAPVDLADDLTHVLDDADLVSAPDGTVFTSSDPAQVDVGSYTAPRLSLKSGSAGGVLPGESVTISYRVQVRDTAALGDTVISNFVLAPSVPTPGDPNSCAASTGLCTINYAGAIAVSKTSKASSDPLVVGSTVDYLLTFRSTGKGAVDVNHVDDLTYVLDDADLVDGSLVVSDGLTVEREGDTYVITGSVAAGATSTVSYRVSVVDEATRTDRGGDNLVVNHLLSAGVETPEPPTPGGECVATATSTCHPVAQVDYVKDVTWDGKDQGVPVVAGTVLTYSITITNSGEGPGTVSRQDLLSDVLDDATVISQPVVTPDNGSVLAGAINNNRFTISGTLAAKESVVVSYQVQVKADAQRADGTQAVNWLVKPGGSVEPGAVCEESDSECTVTALPKLAVSKTSDPEPGSALQPGDTVNYTVTYHNSGTEVAPVDRVDDLTHVLDDADVDVESFQSSDEAQVAWSYDQDAQRLVMTSGTAGGVLPGETVEITYTVTIKPSGQQGDHTLTNYVLSPDQDVPGVGECTAGMVCVVNFSGDLSFQKEAKPSATPLLAGDTVDYTLSFTNHSETAPVDVSHVDLLTYVADDAEIGEAVASGDLTVTPAGDRFLIGGSVAPGQTETVTYTVTVKADGARGDNMLVNHLLTDPNGDGDVEVPGEPDPNGECTSTTTSTCQEVAQVVYTKTVEADPDTLVDGQIVAGTVLRYTVDIHNIGRGEADVFRTDDMSDVLDDTELVDQPVSDNPSVTATEVEGDAFTMSGTLGTDQRAVVTYAVRVLDELDRMGGNNSADNFLVDAEGESSCEPGDENPECSVTALPNMGYQKQAVVDESTLVDGKIVAGTLVHYTVKITNTGQATGVVDREDLLADVLDNAAFAAGGEPVSDVASVLVSPVVDQKFSMSGTLAAQSVAMVTYTVAVLPDVERAGNNTQAANFVVVPGGTPEDSCVENSPCTTTELPLVDYEKKVDYDAPIVDGSVLTYTVTVRNSGTAAGWVSREDDLSGVLEEATILTQPTSDNESVQVSAIDEATGRFSISGEIAADTTVTITYQVTIKPAAERAAVDNVANNYVVVPGEPGGPEGCGPDTPCTSTPVPRMVYSKEVVSNSTDPLVESGSVLTYRVTASNVGDAQSVGQVQRTDVLSDVLDDGDVTSAPVVVSGPQTVTVSPIADERFSIGGTLIGGESATVEYQVTIRDEAERRGGNATADNFLVLDPSLPTCEEGQTEGCNPPVCAEDSTECTVTPMPFIDITKSVDPKSGSSVDAEQVLTYTVTFTNTGRAAGEVHRVDDLTHVLDDAALDVESIALDGVGDDQQWSANFHEFGRRIIVDGSLEPGQVVTMTYQVTVNPDGEQGDHVLANFVFRPDVPTPTDPSCTEDMVCTVNLTGDVTATKSSDPVTGTDLRVGDKVTYTLTFTNVGAGTGGVSHTDDLSGVLDDADLTEAPKVSDPTLSAAVTDGKIHITGALSAKSTVTVSYTVTVRAEKERGDSRLANYLIADGQETPETCAEGSTTCTSHPVLKDFRSGVLAITGVTVGAAAVLVVLLIGTGWILVVRSRRRGGVHTA